MVIRRSTSALALLVGIAACTPVGPTPEQEPDPAPAVVLDPPAKATDSGRQPPWRWDVIQDSTKLTPDGAWSSRSFGVWFSLPEAASPAAHAALESDDHGIKLIARKDSTEDEVLWTVPLSGRAAVGAPSEDRRALFVVHHSPIASGAWLAKVDAVKGALVWDVDLEGLGPVEHSKYRNQTQVEVDGDQVLVYGLEVEGRYLEIRDARTGEQVGHHIVEALADDPSPSGTDRLDQRSLAPKARDGEVVHSVEFIDDHLRLRSIAGEVVYVNHSIEQRGCGDALIAFDERVVYVLDFCFISSGANLHALSKVGSEPLWSVPIRGLGPVKHSEYFANYELSVHDGHVRVDGWESAGRFVELRDPETGREVWSVVHRD